MTDFEQKKQADSDADMTAEMTTKTDLNSSENGEEKPRPVIHRILAWLGIIYVVISMLLVWANIITGNAISGIGPLMTTPALIGFGALLMFRRKEQGKPPLSPAVVIAEIVIISLVVFALYISLPVLFSQLSY